MSRSVIVAGNRTAIGKLSGVFASLSAMDLGGAAIKAVLERTGVDPASVDLVLMGQVLQAGQGQMTARQAAVKGGIPMSVHATTINKVCLSGLQTIYLADLMIRAGEADIIIAGGMESMTNAPYLLPGARAGYRIGDQKVVDAMMFDGLTCAFDQCAMGLATDRYNRGRISRARQDEFSARSHQLAAAAISRNRGANAIPSLIRVRVPNKGRASRVGITTETILTTALAAHMAARRRRYAGWLSTGPDSMPMAAEATMAAPARIHGFRVRSGAVSNPSRGRLRPVRPRRPRRSPDAPPLGDVSLPREAPSLPGRTFLLECEMAPNTNLAGAATHTIRRIASTSASHQFTGVDDEKTGETAELNGVEAAQLPEFRPASPRGDAAPPGPGTPAPGVAGAGDTLLPEPPGLVVPGAVEAPGTEPPELADPDDGVVPAEPGAVAVGVLPVWAVLGVAGCVVAAKTTLWSALSGPTLPAASCCSAETAELPTGTPDEVHDQLVFCTVAVQAAKAPANTVTSAPFSPVPVNVTLFACTVAPAVGVSTMGTRGASESTCMVRAALRSESVPLKDVDWVARAVRVPLGISVPRLHDHPPRASATYEQEYGPRSTYLPARWPAQLPADAARRRMLLDLPVDW